jgi:SAM-dependent methyltransferase
MRLHWQDLLADLNYQEGETIIDVGGAMDPVPIANVVVDIVNLGRGGLTYTLLDLCSDRLPFEDDAFDICICSQTLEDLPSPKLALQEISRVAKRGIIEVPFRGPESVKNLHYNGYEKPPGALDEVWCFGTEHHKWLCEEIDGVLHFTFKNQMHLMRHPIPKWTGRGGIRFQWEGSVPFQIHYDMDQAKMDQNYARFRNDNRESWE